jgi:acetate kinase
LNGSDFTLDAARNQASAPIISAEGGRVMVRIIPTDEELMIARYRGGDQSPVDHPE